MEVECNLDRMSESLSKTEDVQWSLLQVTCNTEDMLCSLSYTWFLFLREQPRKIVTPALEYTSNDIILLMQITSS